MNNQNLMLIGALVALIIYVLLMRSPPQVPETFATGMDNNANAGNNANNTEILSDMLSAPLLLDDDLSLPDCDSCPIRYHDAPLPVKVKKVCREPKSIQQFQDEFFKFRDFTCDNSSMRYDAVDKMNDHILAGTFSQTNGQTNKSIKEIFDSVTSNDVNLYEKECVREPRFDNVNNEGYRINPGTPGTIMTHNNFEYKKEKIMNGGPITDSLYPNDLYAGGHFPYDKLF